MAGTEMPEPISRIGCVCGYGACCACGDTEAHLRAGAPLTDEQREWCLNEIASVEGYERDDHVNEDDAQLGRSVLNAWTDYCRDKGLL
jgi:hypothetical protein